MAVKKITRRNFCQEMVKYGVVLTSTPCWLEQSVYAAVNTLTGTKTVPAKKTDLVSTSELSVVSDGSPEMMVQKSIDLLGGIQKYVHRGDVVVIKPNLGFDRGPELACTTNPQVVAKLVELCYTAGAKTIKVFDRTCDHPPFCYQNSGIKETLKNTGAEVKLVDEKKFVKTSFPGTSLKEWPVYREILECDTFINVPIAKVHSLTQYTLGIKNLMGILGGNRGLFHIQIHQWLADLVTLIKPKLTVIDAVRMRVRSGPSGGKIADVKKMDTIVAGSDYVATDSYAVSLFEKHTGKEVEHLRKAYEYGLGEINLNKLKINRFSFKT